MCENNKEKLNHEYEGEQQNNNCVDKDLIQFILDEDKSVIEMPKSLCKNVEYPVKYRLQNAFEVFVRVEGTENYWISNYGRCINNLNHKDKDEFYEHKNGQCHYTVFEIERSIYSVPITRYKNGKIKRHEEKRKTVKRLSPFLTEDEYNNVLKELQENDEKRIYSIETTRYRRETSPEELVVKHFLVNNRRGCKVWHKDGDKNNNWYKNLILVTPKEYKELQQGRISWDELEPRQEYNEYVNKATVPSQKK